ncbi:MAG: DUF1684 domain-containing protein [Bacteroidales bacterium]|jgi:uncharacterized protein (DUF1684 family)|nr:DUF1684 domain-containing protein [Bacteroidales bacterium]
MKFYNKIFLIVFLGLFACNNTDNTEYVTSIKNWQVNRLESLKSKTGWLNLVGLYWLKEGENSFGSDSSNQIIFPLETPKNIGVITLHDSVIKIDINKSIDVFCNDEKISERIIKSDASGNASLMKIDSYAWFIIKRNGKYAIRLRNYKSELINQINEIPTFPIDKKWRIKAKFIEFAEKENISVPSILGYTSIEKSIGMLEFDINDKTYSLRPLINDDGSFFVIFADATSANETYGAGRFLGVDKPNEENLTYIDFNKAYNPPCAFTHFATCPLPPIDNILPIEIRAGEKKGENFGLH